MQTSIMMLDSTSSKILNDDQDGLPLQNDIDKSKVDADNRSAASEAEVRLVVKFIVEEHIVYEGKVERVHQLESEELSRVVSRVAWDSAKESTKSTIEVESDKAKERAAVESDKPDQPRLSALSTQHDGSTNSQTKDVLESGETTKEALEETVNEIGTLDHVAYIKPTSDETQLEASKDEDNFVPQVQRLCDVESPTNTDCDNTLERTLNHICQTDQLSSPRSSRAQKSIKQDLEEEFSISNKAEKVIDFNQEPIQELPRLIEDPSGESQSISETLNDCVNNVDLASRQEALSMVVAQTHAERLTNLLVDSTQYASLVPNGLKSTKETCKDISNTNIDVMKTKIFGADPVHNRDQTVTCLKKEYSGDISITSARAKSKNDSSVYMKDPPKNDTSCNSSKRKASGDNKSSCKRVRKTTTKDRRHSNAGAGANSNIDNLGTIHQDVSRETKSPETLSLLMNNQHARQNKIFAKWSDNHFYPGTILKMAKDRKFVIGFFDGAQRNVAETDLIPLANIEGKQVRVSIAKNYCVNAIVHDQRSSVNEQPMFNVEYQQDGLVQKCVPLKDIFLTGEQGVPLISQVDRISGASNFADVDLDNIIYEKRSRRLQEMEDFELTGNPPINSKRKRGQYNMRNITPRPKNNPIDCLNSPVSQTLKRNSHSDINQDPESAESPDVLKTNFLCPNSNPPSESSSSTGSSNVPNTLDLGQEFYFTSSSPHRTKTSLLL